MAGVGWDLASPSLQPSGKAFGPEEPNQMDHRFLGCCPLRRCQPHPATFGQVSNAGGVVGSCWAQLSLCSTAFQGWDLGDILVQKLFRNLELKSFGRTPNPPQFRLQDAPRPSSKPSAQLDAERTRSL